MPLCETDKVQRSLKGDRWQVSGELESGVWLLLVSTFLATSIYFNLSLKKTNFSVLLQQNKMLFNLGLDQLEIVKPI